MLSWISLAKEARRNREREYANKFVWIWAKRVYCCNAIVSRIQQIQALPLHQLTRSPFGDKILILLALHLSPRCNRQTTCDNIGIGEEKFLDGRVYENTFFKNTRSLFYPLNGLATKCKNPKSYILNLRYPNIKIQQSVFNIATIPR